MSLFLRALGLSLDGRDTDPAYAAAWRTVRAAADASLTSTLTARGITDRLSGWGHNYYCPEHGGALEFDETQPDRHRCAEFDHEVTGEQFDTGWAYVRNNRLLDHLAASSLATAVTGADPDAERAVEILTGLAEVYAELPRHGTKVGQGRLLAQSLEEAVAATGLARSFALIADRLTRDQQQLIMEQLFRPMADVIADQLMNRTHNIEVWHLAGLASLAVVLDDRPLAYATLNRRHGIRDQLADGVLPDGWWYEGAPGYHFYMLTAVLAAVESYRALGIETDAADTLERMLLTPIETARNDLTVPAFNDGNPALTVAPGLAARSDLYVRGARVCRSTRLDRFLESPLSQGFDRTSSTYLIFGRGGAPSPGPVAGWPVGRRDVLPDSGYAILRRPTAADGGEPDTCVFLKYGPHGGGHGQPDKLEIDLMINGARVIADPGCVAYTHPLHRPWYVQTWSHSTILIDRISQPPIKGTLLGHRPVTPDSFGMIDAQVAFGEKPDPEGVQVLWHQDDPAPVAAYAGVTLRRLLIMTPPALGDYLLDLVLVDADHRHSIDLITHVRGTLITDDPGRPATDRMLLPHFSRVCRVADPTGRTDYVITDDGRPLTRWHAGADELLTAVTPDNPPHQTCASTVERVVGDRALFASALSLGPSGITGLRLLDGGVEVVLDGTSHHWQFDPTLRADPASTRWTEPLLGVSLRS
ncbi:heparinase II/III domain-containing protein [Microlunatus parietis]|uniref:Heparinase II/III-like protein n=1 Tax=Microlunatus parietis TaxID=682979 RepID=A0A7Y9LBP9_9ACTN|nr:heparinase II/III family protein [Microlunatus parietis]NYE70875.1 hypothetical protein [Microlunatus parietis]